MKLAAGSRMAIEVEPVGKRLRVSLRQRVGHSGFKDIAPPKDVDDWASVWAAIELLAQEQLARLGLDEVRRRQ